MLTDRLAIFMSGMKPGSPKKDKSAGLRRNYGCGTSVNNEPNNEAKSHSFIQTRMFNFETGTVG